MPFQACGPTTQHCGLESPYAGHARQLLGGLDGVPQVLRIWTAVTHIFSDRFKQYRETLQMFGRSRYEALKIKPTSVGVTSA